MDDQITALNGPHEAGTRKRRRSPATGRRPKASSGGPDLLVCLPETEALLAINAGAITYPVPPEVAGPGKVVACWRGQVPRQVVLAVEASTHTGKALVFRLAPASLEPISVEGAEYVALPVSMSKIREVAVETPDYLASLVARVEDFPDMALSTVSLVARPELYSPHGPDSYADIEAWRDRPPAAPLTAVGPAEDKVGGALAGLLVGLSQLPGIEEFAEQAWRAVGEATGDAGQDLILSVGRSLSLEPPDRTTELVVAALLKRLAALSSRDGIDAEALLAAVAEDVGPQLDDAGRASLERFVAAALPIVGLHPGSSRELLQDGGSVMMRGAVAFLRVPSVERLVGGAAKGGRVGSRVALFALVLAGYYEGSGALSREIKAAPVARLAALGDAIEAVHVGRGIDATSRRVLTADLNVEWVATLFGKDVARREMSTPVALRGVLSAAQSEGWGVELTGAECAVRPATLASRFLIKAAQVPRGPVELPGAILRVSLVGDLPRAPAAALNSVVAAVSGHDLAVRIANGGAGSQFWVDVFIPPADANPVRVAGGVARLLSVATAVDAVLPAAQKARSGRTSRRGAADTESAPSTGT